MRIKIVIVVLLLSFVCPAGAVVVSDTFGPDDTYDPDRYLNVATYPYDIVEIAAPFLSRGFFTVDTIELGIVRDEGIDELWLRLHRDASGVPGSILELIQISGVVPTSEAPAPPVVATSQLHPLLSPGGRYWVSAYAPWEGTDYHWHINGPGTAALLSPSYVEWTTISFAKLTMRINGTPISVIPEPSAWAMMISGVLVLACLSLIRRKGPGRSAQTFHCG